MLAELKSLTSENPVLLNVSAFSTGYSQCISVSTVDLTVSFTKAPERKLLLSVFPVHIFLDITCSRPLFPVLRIGAENLAQLVESLLTISRALGSIPSIT